MSDPGLGRLAAALAGRYAVERELGRGGMATVYLAEDLKHHRAVAIKLLSPDLSALLGRDRFLREIQLMARLQHPHVLALHDSGEAGGLLYYVMPYIEGESLRDRLRREARLPPEEALRLAQEVAEGLDYAHTQGVVHRDIKPENILLSRGHALVADFGIGHVADADGGVGLTATGIAVGTPTYMSPEQACGEPVSPRSDVYSLGAMLFEMLAGVPAFAGPTPKAILARRLREAPPSVRSIRRDVPRAMDAAIRAAMARDPSERFATAGAFVTACRGDSPVRVAGGRGRWARSGLLLVAAAGLIIGGRWALSRPGPPSASPAHESRLALMPWVVRGGEGTLDYLGEGMVDLLSGGLDGAAGWRVVDANGLISFVHRECAEGVSQDCGARAARRFGATRYVMGSVVAVGQGRVRLSATPYEIGRGPGATVQATGSIDSLERTVNQVARGLLLGGDSASTNRLTEVAAVTTSSVAALRGYLEGFALFRAGHYCPAVESFKRAVTEDSTFALAYYRLAMADSWGCETASFAEARAAADAAVLHSGSLSERDQRMLRAFRAYTFFDVDRADSGYRVQVQIYPDDVEAWYMLGETLMHENYLRGRSINEARESFERAASADLPPIGAPYHLVEIAAMDGRLQEAETLATRFVRLFPSAGPNGDHTWWIGFSGRLAAGPSDTTALLRELTSQSRFRRGLASYVAGWHFADLALARRIDSLSLQTSRPASERRTAESGLATMALGAGQPADARRRFADLAKADSLSDLGSLALAATFLPSPASRADLVALRARLARMDSTRAGVTRLSWLALIDLRAGDTAGAAGAARRLAAWRATRDSAVARVLGNGILAEQAWTAGRADRALEIMGTAPVPPSPLDGEDLSSLVTYHSFVRGELLHAAGRDREALGWYLAVAEHDHDGYLAPASLRLGEIYEGLGDRRLALWHYGRFVRLWHDTEPALRPWLEEGRRGLRRLAAEPQS